MANQRTPKTYYVVKYRDEDGTHYLMTSPENTMLGSSFWVNKRDEAHHFYTQQFAAYIAHFYDTNIIDDDYKRSRIMIQEVRI